MKIGKSDALKAIWLGDLGVKREKTAKCILRKILCRLQDAGAMADLCQANGNNYFFRNGKIMGWNLLTRNFQLGDVTKKWRAYHIQVRP